MSVEVRPVQSRAERRAFVRFPWNIYPGRYPAWVPPLLSEERKRIDPKKNPFFEHGAVQLFLAYQGGKLAGRIAAIENRLHNEFHGDNVGFFGMFESVEDADVAAALLDRAAEWVRGRGLDRLRGPTNFSTNEDCGLLLDNFEDPPMVMMPYNPPYYAQLLEKWGLEKVKDLLGFRGTVKGFPVERLEQLARRFSRSGTGMSVRGLRMNRFNEEVELIRQLYNSAWEKNWGFVPMTDAEVDHMAKQLKPVVDPELALIGEINGEPIGFALALPDVNQAIRHLNGRLFPFGSAKLLWHMKRINGVRIITLGLKEEYRQTGLASLFYLEVFKRAMRGGHTWGESSWILEDNMQMLSGAEKMKFVLYKTYRLYEKALVS
jgi:GNAT superfamily N-acetyltransferase